MGKDHAEVTFPISPETEALRTSFSWPDFCKAIKFAPHRGQIPPLLALQDPEVEVVVMVCGRRFGKTKLCGVVGAGTVICPDEGGIAWAVGPTYQLAQKVYREADLIVRRDFGFMMDKGGDHKADMNLQLHYHPDLQGKLPPNELWGKSAESPDSLLGEGLRLAILDEAARLAPEIWNEYVSPALEERHGRAVIITTPKGMGHWTYSMWKQGRHPNGTGPATEGPIRAFRFPSWVNPLISRDRIEKRLAEGRMTERSYRENYCAEFLPDGGMIFKNPRKLATLDPAPPVSGMSYSMGLDLARYDDFTVLTIMNRNKEVCYAERFPHTEWHIQETKAIEVAKKYNRATIVVDASGVGDPIEEQLRRAYKGPVQGFRYTGTTKGELIDNLVIMFEREEIRLLKPERFPFMIDELEAFEYVLTKARRLKMEAPSGQKDDCVNSLALAAWTWRNRPKNPIKIVTPRIQITSSYTGGKSHERAPVHGYD